MSTMSINATTERRGILPGWLRAAPWSTVVPLAVVLAFADGFWVISLRGAVGSIERTGAPFASWLRESTLTLPLFVLAVIGALTLAARWFGPVLRRPRTVIATILLVVAAGTLVGVAALAASSAYDYYLQANLLQLMGSTHHSSGEASVLLQQQASLGLQVKAVLYGSGMLLLTNIALVPWVVALQGGRLDVSRTRQ